MNYDKITSVIVDKGVDYRYGSKGNKSKYIELLNTKQIDNYRSARRNLSSL